MACSLIRSPAPEEMAAATVSSVCRVAAAEVGTPSVTTSSMIARPSGHRLPASQPVQHRLRHDRPQVTARKHARRKRTCSEVVSNIAYCLAQVRRRSPGPRSQPGPMNSNHEASRRRINGLYFLRASRPLSRYRGRSAAGICPLIAHWTPLFERRLNWMSLSPGTALLI